MHPEAAGRRSALEFLVAAQIGCSLILLVASVALGRTLVDETRKYDS